MVVASWLILCHFMPSSTWIPQGFVVESTRRASSLTPSNQRGLQEEAVQTCGRSLKRVEALGLRRQECDAGRRGGSVSRASGGEAATENG